MSYINSKIKIKTGTASLTTSNGDSATTPLQKSELLNSYFSSVFTSECLETLPGMGDFNYEEPFSVVNVTNDTVFNKLKNLKSSKSAGSNGLHPRVLREAAAQLCVPLTILFKRSLDEGLLPEDWKLKRANMIPIFKKGEISDPGNYRPISLTCAVCKVLESIIIRESIIEHMTCNNLISNAQHGFLPKRSCVSQLLTSIEYWTDEMHKGKPVDVIYVNFKKDFDKVPHE